MNLDKVRHQVIHVLSQSSANAPAQEPKRSSKTPTLDQLGINLTELARSGKLDPVIGREKEIERVIQILGRKTKNNPRSSASRRGQDRDRRSAGPSDRVRRRARHAP